MVNIGSASISTLPTRKLEEVETKTIASISSTIERKRTSCNAGGCIAKPNSWAPSSAAATMKQGRNIPDVPVIYAINGHEIEEGHMGRPGAAEKSPAEGTRYGSNMLSRPGNRQAPLPPSGYWPSSQASGRGSGNVDGGFIPYTQVRESAREIRTFASGQNSRQAPSTHMYVTCLAHSSRLSRIAAVSTSAPILTANDIRYSSRTAQAFSGNPPPQYHPARSQIESQQSGSRYVPSLYDIAPDAP